jgi:hypothetical protein
VSALEKTLKTAGYTDVRSGRPSGHLGSRKESLDCTCTAWSLETTYNGVTVREACTVQAHYDAKRKADSAEYDRAHQLRARVRARLAEVLVEDVAELSPWAARVALWIVLSWGIENWTKEQDAKLVNALDETKPKRKKRDPWATLTEASDDVVRAELAKALAANLRDGNFKVGWDVLAAELGVTDPPATPKPEKVKGQRFTAEQARQAAAELERDLDG